MGRIFTPQNTVYSTDARAVLNPISLSGTLTSYSGITKTASYKGTSASFNLSGISLVYYSIDAQTDNYYWQNINDAIGSLLYQFSNGKFYALQCHLVFGSVTNDYPDIENFYVAEQRHQISGRDIVTVSAGITGYLVNYYPLWGVLYYQAAKVSFNVNGGSGSPVQEQIISFADAVSAQATITRTGYTLAGWNTQADGSGQSVADGAALGALVDAVDSSGNLTLYAQWTPKTSALTFNVNGGSGTMSTGIVATYGQAMPTPVNLPTRVGYAFTGFYDATSGGTKYYNADGTSARTWNKNKTSGTTLYAQWTPKTSELTFNVNGGSGTMTTGLVATYDAAMPTGITLPTRTGYTFAGFYDATSGGTKYYNADGTSARTWNKDTTSGTTLYAQWIKYATLYFYPNGGTGTMPTGLIAYKGQAMPTVAAANLPTKTGYIFTGFYTANLGGTKYYNADGTSAQNWDSDANTLQLFAQWHSTTMSVTFNPNGGTLAGNEFFRQLVLNDTYGTLPTPTRTGYRFLGWYTAASGGTKVTVSTQRTVLADHILYAHWSANPSKIVLSFQPMGGTCQTRTKNCNVNAAYGTLPTPTRTGYTFDGWFTASSGGTQVSSATVAGTVNVTLYAHWTLTNPEPEPEPVAIDWWGIILS